MAGQEQQQSQTTSSPGAIASGQPNRLINEKSPYLLQHAYNPVDWHPWGDEAFNRAQEQDKPIFLSIGYSTCHWCHVMEHESFEDPEVAEALNRAFISIKVDREERPDIDQVYMTVCQMMNGNGGWPLTIIMTPDKQPFFSGTYFPKQTQAGRLGMMDLINKVGELWGTHREKLLQSAQQVQTALEEMVQDAPGPAIDRSVLDAAYTRLLGMVDRQWGGFGSQPKFPTPHKLEFLLNYWKRSGESMPLDIVKKSLKAMYAGGMFDHVGFGFHRYSTDRQWLVPHFEKMLYDQAQLASLYTKAYQATGDDLFKQVANEILSYVLRDLQAPNGGFYSAEDADSEGVEGKFYVWSEAELKELLTPLEMEFLHKEYGVKSEGNFEEEASGQATGLNILNRSELLTQNDTLSAWQISQIREKWEPIREKLFQARNERVRPHLDDKILTDWNALMISALALAGSVFENDRYVKAAERAASFLHHRLTDDAGRLLHRYRDGEAAIAAFADDYAFTIAAMLDLYEATFNIQYLHLANEYMDDFIERFWDQVSGGFYSYDESGEQLITRQKEIYDGAVPSANSVAAMNLLRLGRITGDLGYIMRADMLWRSFSTSVQRAPFEYTRLLLSVDFGLGPSAEVVIVGKPGKEDVGKMFHALRKTFLPNKVVLFRPSTESLPGISSYATFTKDHTERNRQATAYVCVNQACQLPTNSPAEMLDLLDGIYQRSDSQ